MAEETGVCAVCGGSFPVSELKPVAGLLAGTAEALAAAGPLPSDALICRDDRARARRLHVERLLEQERGVLGELDREVLESIDSGLPVVQDVESVFEERRGFGERASDSLASFGGSWPFIILFLVVLVIWMAVNALRGPASAFDPYPFILLNLVLSCIAALQAPIIMMSQRRQEARDRLQAENDYKVNLKAELEIRHLHEKLDHQLQRQWERLAEIQRVQIELLEELAADPRR
ncbi:MAG: DUF1003 domain-containing protein [Amaricoccus sp.]